MREIRPSGSEGGVAHLRHPYPYPSLHRCAVHAAVRFRRNLSHTPFSRTITVRVRDFRDGKAMCISQRRATVQLYKLLACSPCTASCTNSLCKTFCFNAFIKADLRILSKGFCR